MTTEVTIFFPPDVKISVDKNTLTLQMPDQYCPEIDEGMQRIYNALVEELKYKPEDASSLIKKMIKKVQKSMVLHHIKKSIVDIEGPMRFDS